MKHLKRKLITLLTAICMICTMSVPVFGAENPDANKLSNPRVTEARPATWDCVWFGNYPQSSDGNDGFDNEPIKWRVLSVEGDEALLLADKNLDAKKYNENLTDVTWETSSIRKWLNGSGKDDFLGKAFTTGEQAAIYEKVIKNPENVEYETVGGNDTKDKVFFLSMDEVMNPDYGFLKDSSSTETRKAKPTSYAANRPGHELWISFSESEWWLRSPGSDAKCAVKVSEFGSVHKGGTSVEVSSVAVRPALRLNLKSDQWSYAGTVSSDGDENEVEKGQGAASVSVKNPIPVVIDAATWDCVYFGHYPQTSKEDGGFNNDSIKWRVLSVEGNQALLLADRNLDIKKYHETSTDTTWENSTIRKWLNGSKADEFLGKAFTSAEQAAICTATVKNPDGGKFQAEENYDTEDRIFFLSMNEAMNPSYGFPNNDNRTKTRESLNTAYTAKVSDLYAEGYGEGVSSEWWLRSSGNSASIAANVWSSGSIDIYDGHVDSSIIAIRPVLYLDLTSGDWSYAGTISSEDKVAVTGLTLDPSVKTLRVGEECRLTAKVAPSDAANKSIKWKSSNKAVADITEKDAVIAIGAGEATIQAKTVDGGFTAECKVTVLNETGNSNQKPATPGTDSLSTLPSQKDEKNAKSASKISKPKKPTLKKAASTKKGTLKLTWKRNKKATGYQAVVATDKKFKKNKKTATIKRNKTVSKAFTKLKRQKTYFAKVRAYKQVGKTKVYGAYSKVKKARVK